MYVKGSFILNPGNAGLSFFTADLLLIFYILLWIGISGKYRRHGVLFRIALSHLLFSEQLMLLSGGWEVG